ncbi:Tetratricopeptide repeat-containing protein [Alkalispirochaeta americana]|uniref:Tetratricopeptide repeat-containing protein n=2 Tax=Alkalispirochaeta americana TaxID=159291 RepID=A0A1N6RIQ8_9SPIO|nr:Tetratricopeptide repeat-containing protein [Alkalispirochaeta americana]
MALQWDGGPSCYPARSVVHRNRLARETRKMLRLFPDSLDAVPFHLIYSLPMRFAIHLLVVFALFFVFGCATPPEVEPPVPEVPEISDDPDEPDAPVDPVEEAYEAVSLAVMLGKPQEAIEAFEAAQLADPGAPETQVLLAHLYLAAGDLAGAETLLQEVLEANPKDGDALFSLALIAGARGESRQEQRLLEELLEIDPKRPEALAALGEVQLRSRRFDPAERSFLAALDHDPRNSTALLGMGNLALRRSNPSRAEQYLDRAIEAAPDIPRGHADRSRARAIQGKFAAAEADLNRAVELEPDFLWHYYDRGVVRMERNNFAGALDDFNRVIDRDPSLFMAFVYRARAYDQKGEGDLAMADYKTALELRPDYQPALAPLGVLKFEAQQFSEAAERFQAALEKGNPNDPTDYGLLLLTSLSLKMAGEEARARRYLEERGRDFAGSGLYADMARYYANPGSDAFIYRQVTREEDRFTRLRASFYLAGQYEVLGRLDSARALYLDIIDADIRGLMETRLARRRYEQLRGDS